MARSRSTPVRIFLTGCALLLSLAAPASEPSPWLEIHSTHFTVNVVSNNYTTTQNSLTTYPFIPPPLTRSGNVLAEWSTWKMDYTDVGTTASLSQTPLN